MSGVAEVHVTDRWYPLIFQAPKESLYRSVGAPMSIDDDCICQIR